MKKYFVFMMMSCLLLGGCSENLAVQSMRWAIEALEEGDFKEARSYIAFAQNEGNDPEYASLYAQMQSLIEMMEYLEDGELDAALLAWTDLNLVNTKSEVVKEVAIEKLQQMLGEMIVTCEEAVESGEFSEEKGMINQVIKRLGDMKVFNEQMAKLKYLRRRMNE